MTDARPFPAAARESLADSQLRHNLAVATTTIRARRAAVVGEVADWEGLRRRGAAVKAYSLEHLDELLEQLEASVTATGGVVHWAADAAAARRIVTGLVAATGAEEVLKVKSLTTDEIDLNAGLAAAGVAALETDLAELVVQLAGDRPSHIVVPAIHKNRAEIRDLFARTIGPADLTDSPAELAAAARAFLRRRFLAGGVTISGANFAAAESGAICVVESEGNGRMCLTLASTLITVMGIEKVVPRLTDLAALLALLPRSATGERLNPYTSLWTGVHPGDGPQSFHLVLLDNGRSRVLADRVGRDALRCIRCAACLNVCPVYERAGGGAYGTTYPGPIGAILEPQRDSLERRGSLPFASSLCGACAEVCPVGIDIPRLLVHLRGAEVDRKRGRPLEGRTERTAMAILARAFSGRRRYEAAQRLGRGGDRLARARGAALRDALMGPWTRSRELPVAPDQTFREWWRERAGEDDRGRS
ncbi:MAG: lactate utilization protein [Actinobacteria bacterium]|nr:lactate utilization protein [Actinomycetota bacterium]